VCARKQESCLAARQSVVARRRRRRLVVAVSFLSSSLCPVALTACLFQAKLPQDTRITFPPYLPQSRLVHHGGLACSVSTFRGPEHCTMTCDQYLQTLAAPVVCPPACWLASGGLTTASASGRAVLAHPQTVPKTCSRLPRTPQSLRSFLWRTFHTRLNCMRK
jgi:hypothetical protein